MFEDNLKERYGLAIDRIAEIKENSEIEDAGLAAYFTYTAEFLLLVDKWNEKRKAGGYDKLPLEELQHWNTVLYEDILCLCTAWRRHRQDFIVFVYRTARVYRVCSRTA